MKLDEFKGADNSKELPAKAPPNKQELDAATYALHKAYLLVDTLLRNMPEK